MLDPEKLATIRRLYYAEHWKIGTIAAEPGVHCDTVRAAIETDPLHRPRRLRLSRLDPYLPFLRETLEQYPRLRETRLLEMIRLRGYAGSIQRLRCVVARLRPATKEPFLHLVTLPGEQAQVDWAHFGEVLVGRAKRKLSCFVMTLSFSRALYLEFFFDLSQENFFSGHVAGFEYFTGCARVILYDNLKAAVLARQGSAIRFHPRLLELCSHYHFQPRSCAPGKGNQKGKVERAIRYVRESFFEGTRFTTLEDLNRRAWTWRDQVAHARPWPDDGQRRVADVFAEEKPWLLSLPAHPFVAELMRPVKQLKGIRVPFDRGTRCEQQFQPSCLFRFVVRRRRTERDRRHPSAEGQTEIMWVGTHWAYSFVPSRAGPAEPERTPLWRAGFQASVKVPTTPPTQYASKSAPEIACSTSACV